MSLIGPILDDRSYDDLRRELIERIPVYAPEWTDHNESDPGITLVELLAYLLLAAGFVAAFVYWRRRDSVCDADAVPRT